MAYLAKIFQDVGGEPSSKRWVLFIFVLLFVTVTLMIYFRAVDPGKIPFLQSALDRITDIIKWMGGFVVAERAPQLMGRKDA
jgi:uncharacterized membrane protein